MRKYEKNKTIFTSACTASYSVLIHPVKQNYQILHFFKELGNFLELYTKFIDSDWDSYFISLFTLAFFITYTVIWYPVAECGESLPLQRSSLSCRSVWKSCEICQGPIWESEMDKKMYELIFAICKNNRKLPSLLRKTYFK